ncbi:MAG: ABC transporter permease [Bacteroidota bacterium]
MLKYIFKRILIFIPTLIAVSLLTFVISTNAPGDPVESMLNKNQGGEGQASQKLATEKAYNDLRHQLGLDLPIFYFSFTNATLTDTLYKISKGNHRNTLERLAYQYGNWKDVAAYYKAIRNFEMELYYYIPRDEKTKAAIAKAKDYTAQLYDKYSDSDITFVFSNLDYIFTSTPALKDINGPYNALKRNYDDLIHKQNILNRYIPVIHWYGFNNQYHNWITKFLVFDFGMSYQDKRPVKSVLMDALPNTLWLSVFSIILAYALAIPIGVRSAIHKGKMRERVTTSVLFMLYSLPNFWIGTMLVIYLCCGDYLCWFPAPGSDPIPDDAPFSYKFTETIYRSILPLFCWTYASLAFISRQMRGGMLGVIGQDYIRTARAKGLDEKTVVWKHAFRNSLLPIITLFANVFPYAISGSIIIEYIFQIPGMGKLTIEAIYARNYPVIFTTMMFTATLTMIGALVADILYAAVDPRISFSGKK